MIELFFRIFQHLLPDAIAWRIRQGSTPWIIGDGSKIGDPGLKFGGTAGGRFIDRFFEGLAAPFVSVRKFVDDVYLDLFPASTREISEWENQFGLTAAGSDDDRRDNIAAAWQSQGGQSPRYLQDVLQAAGFDVFVHEWFSSGPPYVARDPRLHTNVPLYGLTQCGEALAQCGEELAVCDNSLSNEAGYFDNLNLTQQAPPPVPSNPVFWPFFIYWGAAVFPNKANVPSARRGEFERLLLKLDPNQQWIVTLVNYT